MNRRGFVTNFQIFSMYEVFTKLNRNNKKPLEIPTAFNIF